MNSVILHSSLNFVNVVNCRRLDGHVAVMGKTRNTRGIFAGSEDPGHGSKTLKCILGRCVLRMGDWMQLAKDRFQMLTLILEVLNLWVLLPHC
jgi:hypothetical protein